MNLFLDLRGGTVDPRLTRRGVDGGVEYPRERLNKGRSVSTEGTRGEYRSRPVPTEEGSKSSLVGQSERST